ncbi:MAG: hypothetical protein CM15mP115_13730 [Alphaproteobacteria bacterium]|nr:MAG: hypothetical protein CM15mP115_13730 [Alphaproteobacteria bacterium]
MSGRNAPRVETFGCRLNIWESEVVRDQASGAGLNDAIIFNTCAVTAEAERQARQAIRARAAKIPMPGSSLPDAPRRSPPTIGMPCPRSTMWSAITTS